MWIPLEVYDQFMRETFQPPQYIKDIIKLQYSKYTGEWNIEGKNTDRSILVTNTYGTKRATAYRLLESSLNLKNIQIFDTYTDTEGKEHRELNKKETILASQKQDMIKEKFKDWIFGIENGGKCWFLFITKNSIQYVQDSLMEGTWSFLA